MNFTRREFVKGGVAAFTWGFAAPAIFGDIALAQGGANRNLVVLYLSGGNDSLNTIIPYTDANYYARRPTIAVPAANVLQIGISRLHESGRTIFGRRHTGDATQDLAQSIATVEPDAPRDLVGGQRRRDEQATRCFESHLLQVFGGRGALVRLEVAQQSALADG